ncbi:MAG: hypothetical protein MJZ64_01610 [Paludibacteraceae bacterium]|nr:hypothetical protein [Paludibacteraceae bacterium]
MKELQPFFRVIGYLLAVHVLCLLAMAVCRIILLCANMPAEGIDWTLLPTAMLIGVKFDNLIACYMGIAPFAFMPVFALCLLGKPIYSAWMRKAVTGIEWYFSIVYAVLLFIGVADARYYTFFENHLNISVTEWFGFVGDTAGMVFGDKTNLVFLAIAIVLIAGYIVALKAIGHCYKKTLR